MKNYSMMMMMMMMMMKMMMKNLFTNLREVMTLKNVEKPGPIESEVI